ncbi:MAG: hypothetical protein ABIL39_12055 [candidate division WOR-3 bacterium]
MRLGAKDEFQSQGERCDLAWQRLNSLHHDIYRWSLTVRDTILIYLEDVIVCSAHTGGIDIAGEKKFLIKSLGKEKTDIT